MHELTPKEIVVELDKFIIGQESAKRAVAIALRNRHRRMQLPEELREEISPKNILMIGPTGVGKTEIARRMAQLVKAPFSKIEATKFTEVGYVGRDVDSMIRDLTELSMQMVEKEKMVEVTEQATILANRRLADLLELAPMFKPRDGNDLASIMEGADPDDSNTKPPTPTTDSERIDKERSERLLNHYLGRIESGEYDQEMVEVELDQGKTNIFTRLIGPQGIEEANLDLGDLPLPFANSKKLRRMKAKEARTLLAQEEAQKLLDRDEVVQEAINRVEQNGIIFIDEIDKVAGRESGSAGPDVSREGVQRDLLPILEGSTVITRHGPVQTHHILFIAAGAFHTTKPSDLIPELQGRMPIRVEVDPLGEDDFRRILIEPKNALVKQYMALLGTEGLSVKFEDDALDAIAQLAQKVNEENENIGARRLHTIMERALETLSFDASEMKGKNIVIDANYIEEQLSGIIKDQDLSRYIL